VLAEAEVIVFVEEMAAVWAHKTATLSQQEVPRRLLGDFLVARFGA
jgi:hypothetical protein